MREIRNREKEGSVNEILMVVKLTALLFCGILSLKYTFAHERVVVWLIRTPEFAILVAFLCIAFIYIGWHFITVTREEIQFKKGAHLIEGFYFIGLFFFIILISGKQESPNKFLFLFIITITTIQSGMKYGLIISGIASLLILFLDLKVSAFKGINSYFEDDIVLSVIFVLVAYILGFYVRQEEERIGELKNKANRDGLTGAYNHGYFYDEIVAQMKMAKEEKSSLALLYIDIDHFKYYNDLNGHLKGDEALKKIAQLLQESVDDEDIVARYGGEEFVILLKHTFLKEASLIGEKIRQLVEDTYIEAQEYQPSGNFTISVGVSSYPEQAQDTKELIKYADDALYRAKFFSKNRVEIYQCILDEIKKEIDKNEVELVASVQTLISVVNAKDRYTFGHTERVVIYSRLIAKAFNLTEQEKKNLIYGAYMHDVGKINIPVEILIKKMPLTEDEWRYLKQHPIQGVEIIKNVTSLQGVIPLIKHHHEKYDGTGYPLGLKGEEIPYLARILTIIDSFDAMTSNRPYNIPKTYEEAFEELTQCMGTQFDPQLVPHFIAVMKNNRIFSPNRL